MSTKVTAGRRYLFDPVPLDRFDSRTNLSKGSVVRVVNLPGAPPANTMGHCYVAEPETGKFIGMVCTNSLVSMSDASRIVAELKAQLKEVV
jgi:hypothetical protein